MIGAIFLFFLSLFFIGLDKPNAILYFMIQEILIYELQSEFVFRDITYYASLNDNVIKKGLDKHFKRIQFIAFNDYQKEDK